MSAKNSSHYVSRAGEKIAEAAEAFHVDFRGKTVLDIGSSTGGFTEYALMHGAEKVIAVEKGTDQLHPKLRGHGRIELHEKTDIFTFIPDENPDLILADVSFLSLTKVLDYARINLTGRQTSLLVMMKPQFEAREHQLVNGVIKNNKIRRDIIKNFEQYLKQHFLILGKRDNSLPGREGNVERFYLLKPIK